jgi:hypothetical protein
MIEFTKDEGKSEGVFTVSPQFTNDVIIGCQFLSDHGVSMDFERECFTSMMEGRVKEQVFYRSTQFREAESDIQGLETSYVLTHVPVGQRPNITSAGCKVTDTHLKAPGHSPSRSQPAVAGDYFVNVAHVGEHSDDVSFSDNISVLRDVASPMYLQGNGSLQGAESDLYIIMFPSYEMM